MRTFYRGLLAAIISLILIGWAGLSGANESKVAATPQSLTRPDSTSGCPSVACNLILSLVAKSPSIQSIPANLDPRLSVASENILMPDNLYQCDGNELREIVKTCG